MSGFLDQVTPTTTANYALGALDGVTVNTPEMKILREQAEWNYDVGGDSLQGVVESGFDKPIISAPGMDLTPILKSIVRYSRWTAVWGEIVGAKAVDIGALRRNTGPQALVKFRDKEIPAMLKGILTRQDGFLHQFWNQNIASPTQSTNAISGTTVVGLPMAGVPSFLYPTGGSFNGSSGGITTSALTGVAAVVGDREVVPIAQTYLGLSTAPSGLTGLDNPQFDAWMPTLVNTGSSIWDGTGNHATTTINLWLQWMVNKAMRFGNDMDMNPDPMNSGWLSYDRFQNLGTYIASKQTIYIAGQDGPKSTNASLGTNASHLDHAGMRWQWSERIPTLSAFVIPWKRVRVDVQTLYAGMEGNGNPLGKAGEDAGIIECSTIEDPVRRQWITTGTLPGQFICAPRYFVCGRDYVTA